MLRVGHYLNQFFAGVGGEEQAQTPPSVRPGPVGPGRLLQSLLGAEGTVVSTCVCGDNFFNEEFEAAAAAVRRWLREVRPDVIVAGPAFAAGRYGRACTEVCRLAREEGIPAVTGMHPENPGLLVYRQAYVVPTGDSATGMAPAMTAMVPLVRKLGGRLPVSSAEEEGYLPRGVRRPGPRPRGGAERAVAMLVARMRGEPFLTEIPVEAYEAVAPAPALADLAHSTIALVTTGAIVPKGNPDHLKRCSETRWAKYDIGDRSALTPEEFECVHGGFFNLVACGNPNVVLPLDVMRELEREARIGRLIKFYCTTTGNDQRLLDCRRNGEEIAETLRSARVDGVLLVAT
jgi:betaine reductase